MAYCEIKKLSSRYHILENRSYFKNEIKDALNEIFQSKRKEIQASKPKSIKKFEEGLN